MIFVWLLVAALLHLIEEYVYPGGFLRWVRSAVGFAPNAIEAVVINALFIGLVAAPLLGAGPILTLSVPVLLLTNGALHLVGTIATKRYSPGVITSVVLFFPLGTKAIMAQKISGTGILLGVSWMLVPLTIVTLRRLISTQR